MKKSIKNLAFLLLAGLTFCFAACKTESGEESSADTTAPAKVTNLTATAKDRSVRLTWTDAVDTDKDLYGYEVTWTSATESRAATALSSNSMVVAQGVDGVIVRNLTNGTEYTFSVKTLDTSFNKSEEVTTKATPVENPSLDTMKIALSASEAKSNTTVTVTANITTGGTVKKVVCKQDGSINPVALLADTEATVGTVDKIDDTRWTFTITATDETANGTYTVAAIDSDGREETEQIVINNFDFTGPLKATGVTRTYSANASTITLNWTNPTDEDFDHIELCYTTTDSTSTSEKSTVENITSGTKTFTGIDPTKTYYTFYFVSVDKLGNKTPEKKYMVNVNNSAAQIVSDRFVKVDGATITGANNENTYRGKFRENTTVTLSDFYIGKYELTQKEYKEVMQGQTVTVDGIEYTLAAEPSYCTANSTEYALDIASLGEKQENRPVENVTWYDAVYYCNARSEQEDLTCAYTITVQTVKDGHITEADVTFVDNANGYRLPTVEESEYAARGGDTNADEWNYTFSGATTASECKYTDFRNSGLDAVGWYCYNNVTGTTGIHEVTTNASGMGTHEVGKKAANRLGLYDMSGNVYEWSNDRVSDSIPFFYMCGGSWNNDANESAVGYFTNRNAALHVSYIGFRVACSAN